jgi:hypothetical protein
MRQTAVSAICDGERMSNSQGDRSRLGARALTSQIQTPSQLPGAGKRTLTELLSPQAVPNAPQASAVQKRANAEPGRHAVLDDAAVHAAASRGVATPASPLPHGVALQHLFGRHDISGIKAHTGAEAAASASAMAAEAYAAGEHVVLGHNTDLRTVAHEAAHVVQQRGGVQLKGGVGAVGDPYERHADVVADAVVAGTSAEALLDQMPGSGQLGPAVQRTGATPDRAAGRADADITPPVGGIDKPGFIDHGNGAFVRTGPREAGGTPVRAQPLPPATRVFVSGTHPRSPEWMYVTAFLPAEMVRGYVQGLRINLDLPEPLAELRQLVGGETPEGLAKEKFGHAVRDGHDLRFYENVLLYVNKGRKGISGTFQDPNVLGGGANHIQLYAGHRIWLVSAEFAKSLEGVVPSGSFTGGAVAKAKRFAGHVQDILHSVTESRRYLGEVAGDYAQAIREHENAIIGIVAGFLAAEALSALLAAVPIGVTQIVAVVIQLALSAFGAAGMVEAGAAALQHGAAWLTAAWTADGNPEKIAAASCEFLKMLVSLAMAALSYLGAKGNYGNALKIASSMPTGGLPALAVARGGQMGGAGARTSVSIGPSTGSLGVGGAMMSKAEGGGSSSEEGGSKWSDPVKELEDIKKKLESPEKLSGKEKKALRLRKRELQEQLGQTPEEAPERTSGEDGAGDNPEPEHSGKATGKGSKVDLDAVRDRPAQELISGSLKRSPSYATELAGRTVGELLELQQAGGPLGGKVGKMLKLIKDAERLRAKVK